jgi:hypothetical protein
VTEQTPSDAPPPARRWGARAKAVRARGEGLFARLEEAQAEHASIDVGFRAELNAVVWEVRTGGRARDAGASSA